VRASKEAVPASVRRVFMAAARRGRLGAGLRRHRRRWGLVGGASVLVLLAGWLLWGTSVMGVREVRVTGTAILTPAEVRDVAAVAERTPLLRVRAGEVAARVAALPPVAAVQVRRDWPDTVVIEVVERTAVVVVPSVEGFRLIDPAGVGFHTVPAAPAGLPVLILVEPGSEQPATEAALTVLAALTPQLRAELSAVTVAGPADIRLTLGSGRTVLWGDQQDSADKARVATVLLERDGEVIDVSARGVVSVR
jgi:cell division protein FtsQ